MAVFSTWAFQEVIQRISFSLTFTNSREVVFYHQNNLTNHANLKQNLISLNEIFFFFSEFSELCEMIKEESKRLCHHLIGCQGGTDRMLEVLDAAEGQNVAVAALWIQDCYSETGFHIVIDRNFVCLWRSHNGN